MKSGTQKKKTNIPPTSAKRTQSHVEIVVSWKLLKVAERICLLTFKVYHFKMRTMDSIVAPIANIKFDIEVALEQQLGAQPLPFPGMDSKYSPENKYYVYIIHHFNDVFHYCTIV